MESKVTDCVCNLRRPTVLGDNGVSNEVQGLRRLPVGLTMHFKHAKLRAQSLREMLSLCDITGKRLVKRRTLRNQSQ